MAVHAYALPNFHLFSKKLMKRMEYENKRIIFPDNNLNY